MSIIGKFDLRGKVELSNPTLPQPAAGDPTRFDFEAAERADTLIAWDAFLKQHPDGFYATIAKERRDKLAAIPAVADPPKVKDDVPVSPSPKAPSSKAKSTSVATRSSVYQTCLGKSRTVTDHPLTGATLTGFMRRCMELNQ